MPSLDEDIVFILNVNEGAARDEALLRIYEISKK
jgi:hypothetical protein